MKKKTLKGPNLTKINFPKRPKVRSNYQSIPIRIPLNKISLRLVAKATVPTETILKVSKRRILIM
jgi:hypothetical protein